MGRYTQRLYYALKALRALQRAHPDPILVYQMSKVGSTAVCKSLSHAGLVPLQVHYIHTDLWQSARRHYLDAKKPIPYHFYVGRALRYYLRFTSHRIKVITLVRDPIARYVSAEFQNLRLGTIHADDAQIAARELEQRLASGAGTAFTFSWFEREMKPILGINPAERPFDRAAGFALHEGERADVLVLKLEKLSDVLPGVVSDFVGEQLQAQRANVRKTSKTGGHYRDVLATFALDRAVCERIYDHPWVQHFYTPEEIEVFKRRWTRVTG